MSRTQSPRWLSMITNVLDGLDDTSYTANTNDETFSRLFNFFNILMAGGTLSTKQSANLVDTIKKRLPRKKNMTWNGEISLTSKQIDDAEKNKKYERYLTMSRRMAYANNILMEKVRSKINEVGYDLETLSQLARLIQDFQPVAVEVEPIEEPKVIQLAEVVINRQLPSGSSADDILGKFGFTPKPIQ